jgi:hypothetical protein
MPNYITSSLTSANKNDIKAHIDGVKFICSFLINLTPRDRQKIYKMGNKSVAFVSGVLKALQANPSAVPSAFALSEFEKDYQLYLDLQFVLSHLRPLVEGIEDTLLLLGSELMKQGVSGYKIMRQAARTNSALDATSKELGARFRHATKLKPAVHSVGPSQSLTLHGIVPNRLFKTLNQSAVIVYRGENTTGPNKIVSGNSKISIPKGWNVVTVVNNDASSQAIFSLIQK